MRGQRSGRPRVCTPGGGLAGGAPSAGGSPQLWASSLVPVHGPRASDACVCGVSGEGQGAAALGCLCPRPVSERRRHPGGGPLCWRGPRLPGSARLLWAACWPHLPEGAGGAGPQPGLDPGSCQSPGVTSLPAGGSQPRTHREARAAGGWFLPQPHRPRRAGGSVRKGAEASGFGTAGIKVSACVLRPACCLQGAGLGCRGPSGTAAVGFRPGSRGSALPGDAHSQPAVLCQGLVPHTLLLRQHARPETGRPPRLPLPHPHPRARARPRLGPGSAPDQRSPAGLST